MRGKEDEALARGKKMGQKVKFSVHWKCRGRMRRVANRREIRRPRRRNPSFRFHVIHEEWIDRRGETPAGAPEEPQISVHRNRGQRSIVHGNLAETALD